MLFHITTRSEWDHAIASPPYAPASLASEGFVHLSIAEQWPRTAARFFRGREDLVLLTIEPARLAYAVRYEPADGEHFPHLFGPLDPHAVIEIAALVCDANGVACLSR